jgi:hypothetical protein
VSVKETWKGHLQGGHYRKGQEQGVEGMAQVVKYKALRSKPREMSKRERSREGEKEGGRERGKGRKGRKGEEGRGGGRRREGKQE